MSTPLISVVIPSFKRRDGVLALLADVYKQEGVSFEVIVVDDCSPDDSADAFSVAYPATRVLRNPANGGPAVTRNRGVIAARGDYIVGFDSDVTVPDLGVLRKVAATFAAYPEAAGLAFRLLGTDGAMDDAPRWWHSVPIAGNADRRFYTHYFSGTGYAFRREAMIAAGLFPEILYMHYEEVVLAFRILDNGGEILYCPDIPVVHHAQPTPRRSLIRMFYKPRNQVLLALSCYPWPRAIAYLLPRVVFNLLQAILRGHPGEFFRAMGSARKLSREIMKTRKPLRSSTWLRAAALRRGVYATPPATETLVAR